MGRSAECLTRVALLLIVCVSSVSGHGYLSIPKSRNKLANERPYYENPNYCPHCLNLGGRRTSPLVYPETVDSARSHGLCGDVSSGGPECWEGGDCPSQDHMPGGIFYTPDGIGGKVQEWYTEGELIDVEFVITAHHRGMIELRLCDEARVTQECLNKYEPLHRVRNLDYEDDYRFSAQPIDPAAPYKFFLNPACAFPQDPAVGGYRMIAQFQLPAGVTCERCVIQMWWVTANSCVPPGYRNFDFPDVWDSCGGDGGAGFYNDNGADCEGSTRAEEFWNCADVSIAPGGPTPSPTPAPTPAPTTGAPTPSPTPGPTSSPTPSPTPAPTPSPTTAAPTSSPTPDPTSSPTPTTPTPTPAPTTPAPTGDRPGFCSWNGCIGIAQPDYASWCSQSEPNCIACGSGEWCNGDEDEAPPPAGCSEVVPVWGQCGGQTRDYSGACCANGSSCVFSNQWYSQCKPSRKRARSKMLL
eukprot:jgi/Tetstr1/456191/TSEL_042959.t1